MWLALVVGSCGLEWKLSCDFVFVQCLSPPPFGAFGVWCVRFSCWHYRYNNQHAKGRTKKKHPIVAVLQQMVQFVSKVHTTLVPKVVKFGNSK